MFSSYSPDISNFIDLLIQLSYPAFGDQLTSRKIFLPKYEENMKDLIFSKEI
jgi:hypothetical protein